MANATARRVCPQVAALNGEAARAKRRAELHAIIAKGTDQPASAPAVKQADPGSAALATYLSALGFAVPAGLLSDWLVLVPVLALELGAALALLLVQSVSSGYPNGAGSEHKTASQTELSSERHAETRPGTPQTTPNSAKPAKPGDHPDPNKPSKRTKKRNAKRTRRDAKRKLGNVVRLVRNNGGTITGSQQSMAWQLGLSKTRVNELLRELEGAGAVKLKTSRRGTSVALVA